MIGWTIRSAALVSTLFCCGVGHAEPDAGVSAFLRDHHITRYTASRVDLNGDNRPEVLIYATSTMDDGRPDMCGTGGCVLFVVSVDGIRYRQRGRITIVRPPIRVLPTTTFGWHDLGVRVAGGGIMKPYEAKITFNGHRYLSNPTVWPAVRNPDDSSGTTLQFTASSAGPASF